MENVVFSLPSNIKGRTVLLRYYSVSTDLHQIMRWAQYSNKNRMWPMKMPISALREEYKYISESDFSKSFMVLLDSFPLFQIDIYEALFVELSKNYESKEGDFIINILMHDDDGGLYPATSNTNIAALLVCLEYFFQFPEVVRVIAPIYQSRSQFHALLLKAGFQSYLKPLDKRIAKLYLCTKEGFDSLSEKRISRFSENSFPALAKAKSRLYL